jgi:hypothetical protein
MTPARAPSIDVTTMTMSHQHTMSVAGRRRSGERGREHRWERMNMDSDDALLR